MSAPPEAVADNEMAIHLATGQVVDAARLAAFLVELTAWLRREDNLGPEALIEIAGIESGSVLVRIKAWLVYGNNVAGIGSFGLALLLWLSADNSLSDHVAAMMEDDDVQKMTIVTTQGTLTFNRNESEPVERLRQKRIAERGEDLTLLAEPAEFALTLGDANFTRNAASPLPRRYLGMFRIREQKMAFQNLGGKFFETEAVAPFELSVPLDQLVVLEAIPGADSTKSPKLFVLDMQTVAPSLHASDYGTDKRGEFARLSAFAGNMVDFTVLVRPSYFSGVATNIDSEYFQMLVDANIDQILRRAAIKWVSRRGAPDREVELGKGDLEH